MYTHKIWVWTIDNKKGLQGSTNQLWTLRTWYGLVRKISSATVWRLEVFPSWSGPQDISCEYLPKKSLNGGSFYHSYGINFTNEEFNHELLLVHYIKGVYGIIPWNNYQAKSFLPTIILHQTPKRYPQNSRSGYPSTSHESIYSGIPHFKPPTEIPIKYEGGPKTL